MFMAPTVWMAGREGIRIGPGQAPASLPPGYLRGLEESLWMRSPLSAIGRHDAGQRRLGEPMDTALVAPLTTVAAAEGAAASIPELPSAHARAAWNGATVGAAR